MGSGARYGRAARRVALVPSACVHRRRRGVQGWSVARRLTAGNSWCCQPRWPVDASQGGRLREVWWYVCTVHAWYQCSGEVLYRGARLRAAAVRVLVPLLRACLLHHPLRLRWKPRWLKGGWRRPQLALRRPPPLSASSCLGLPRASASLGQSSAWSRLRAGRPLTQALVST